MCLECALNFLTEFFVISMFMQLFLADRKYALLRYDTEALEAAYLEALLYPFNDKVTSQVLDYFLSEQSVFKAKHLQMPPILVLADPLFEIPHSYVIEARNGPGLIIHLDHVYKCGNIMTDRANLIDPYLSV